MYPTGKTKPADSHAVCDSAEDLAARQTLLIKLSTELACEPRHENMLQKVVEIAHSVLRCGRVWLIVEDHEDDAQHVVKHQAPAGFEERLSPASVVEWVWSKGETRNVPDTRKIEAFKDAEHKHVCAKEAALPLPAKEIISILCMPLKDEKGKVWGVVHAINKRGVSDEPCEFDLADEAMLRFLLSVVVRRLVTYNLTRREKLRSQKKANSLLKLLAGSFKVSKERDITRFISTLLEEAQTVFECERTTLYAVDTFKNELKGYEFTVEGGKTTLTKSRTFKMGASLSTSLKKTSLPIEGLVGMVATSGKGVNVTDAWNDDRFTKQRDLHTRFRTNTLLIAPLKSSQGNVVAVLQCVNKLGGSAFSEDDEMELEKISSVVSDILQKILVKNRLLTLVAEDNEDVEQDLKDMLGEFVVSTDIESFRSRDRLTGERTLSGTPGNLRRPTPLSTLDAANLIEKACTWDFDHWCYFRDTTDKNATHSSFVSGCLDHLTLSDTFSQDQIRQHVRIFRDSYSTNASYHNWDHAFSTFHLAFVLGFRGLLDVVTPMDQLALLLAALGHDVEHPGYNNQFLINKKDLLALRYNDKSVLENHHASITSTILRDLLTTLEASVEIRFRKVVVTTILGTDMAKHQKSIAWLQNIQAKIPEAREACECIDDEASLNLMTAILHCVDLSHPALPWVLHRRLSLQCAEEFFQQYTEEQKLGLPSLPFMGKDPKHVPGLASSQVGFIKFVAEPLWFSLDSATKCGNGLTEALQNMSENHEIWQRITDGQEEPSPESMGRLPSWVSERPEEERLASALA